MTDTETERFEFETENAVSLAKTLLSNVSLDNIVGIEVVVHRDTHDTADADGGSRENNTSRATSTLPPSKNRSREVFEALYRLQINNHDGQEFFTNKEVAEYLDRDPTHVGPQMVRMMRGGLVERHDDKFPYAHAVTEKGVKEARRQGVV